MNLIKFASSPASEKKQESSIRPRKTTSINAQLGRPKEFAFGFWLVFKLLKKAVCAGIICSIAFFPALAAFWRLVFHWQMDMSLVALACMLLRTKSSIRSASCASGPDMDDWTMDQGDQRAGAKFNHKCHVALAVHLLAWSEICFVFFFVVCSHLWSNQFLPNFDRMEMERKQEIS